VNPSNNAGAIVISGKELDALPDDPDELQSDLEALAGPSAGPSGGQMYIDGFTAGQLPPKSSIREIRINQNPFSAEYDQLGYGRIEIFTKPGTDKYHGQMLVIGNDSAFNSPNPYAGAEPPYYTTQYSGNFGGPVSKKASFFFNLDRRNINELTAVNALVLSPTLDEEPLVESIPNPRQRTNLSPRLDWAVTKNNTLTARYQYYRDTETNDGVGLFNLPSQAYYSKSTEQTLQVGDTQVIGTKIVNETRFQYIRDYSLQTPQDTNPVVSVLGNFAGGGNGTGNLQRQPEPLRTAELHFAHSRQSSAEVRWALPCQSGYELFGQRIQRHVHVLIAESVLERSSSSFSGGALHHRSESAVSYLTALCGAAIGQRRHSLCNSAVLHHRSANSSGELLRLRTVRPG
jgi:hypothetical protein